MGKFYCNKCDELVDLTNGKCPKCKTDWASIIEGNTEDLPIREKEVKKTSNEKIVDTYRNLLTIGTILKFSCFFMSIFCLMFMIITKVFSFSVLLSAFVFIFFGIIVGCVFNWMAYMLKTNNEIMKKVK